MIIAVLFGGCRKNSNVDTNNIDKNKAQSKKQEKSVKESDIRTFTNGPLIYNNKSIPVLMYHSIDYEKGNELRLPKEQFKEQMKYLKIMDILH